MGARHVRKFMCAGTAVCTLAAIWRSPALAAEPGPFERLAAFVDSGRGYTMRVESHEERDDRSEEVTYAYVRGPADAPVRVSILEGRGAGTELESRANGRVVVHSSNGRFVTVIASDDARIATLRSTQMRAAGLETFVACARANRAALSQVPSATIDGTRTIALVLKRDGRTPCPGDSPLDGAITADVVYVVPGGTPVLRKRYVGREVVERWRIRNFAVGSSDAR